MADASHGHAALLFKSRDLIDMLERQADVVEPIQQTMPPKRLDLKR
jgi:hypothetical protein